MHFETNSIPHGMVNNVKVNWHYMMEKLFIDFIRKYCRIVFINEFLKIDFVEKLKYSKLKMVFSKKHYFFYLILKNVKKKIT